MEKPEVKITLEAADIHATLTWAGGAGYDLQIRDTSDLPDYPQKHLCKLLTHAQAAAVLALFAAGGEGLDENMLKGLYAIAETAMVEVPQNLRLIP